MPNGRVRVVFLLGGLADAEMRRLLGGHGRVPRRRRRATGQAALLLALSINGAAVLARGETGAPERAVAGPSASGAETGKPGSSSSLGPDAGPVPSHAARAGEGASANASTGPGVATSPAQGLSADESAGERASVRRQIEALTPVSSKEITAAAAGAAPRSGGADTAAGSAPAPISPSKADVDPTTGSGAETKAISTADNELREAFQDRLRWLDEFDKATLAWKAIEQAGPSPEKRMANAREELARLQAALARAETAPGSLLPPSFLEKPSGTVSSEEINRAMKAGLEAAAGEVKDWKARLESLQIDAAGWEARQTALRAERDKRFQRLAALKASAAAPAPPPAAKSSSAPASAAGEREGRLAAERKINRDWETRAEALWLKTIEARIALESKLKDARDLEIRARQAQVRLSEQALAAMQGRYRATAELQERVLKAKAAREEHAARQSGDPLERYRARRLAELLEMEAQVLKNEQAEAATVSPALDQQRELADHAEADFARIKSLVADGRVSRLDAFRLNNDFRRIGPERDRLVRKDQAIAENRLQFYESALTNLEIEMANDPRTDRIGRQQVLDQLPPERRAAGDAVVAALEKKHHELLVRQREALQRLVDRSSRTLEQIARRLNVLEEQYGFIRTHIFWVRDQEPIGMSTLAQGVRDCRNLVDDLGRMANEAARPQNRGRASAEFLIAALAALALPVGLFRLRRWLRDRARLDLGPA